MPIKIIGPGSRREPTVIDVSVRARGWANGLAPSHCGPVALYGGHSSSNVENAYQFCKVLPEFIKEGSVLPAYFKWAKKGWSYKRLAKVEGGEFILWDGKRYSAVEARTQVYIPLYRDTVKNSRAWAALKTAYAQNPNLVLWDSAVKADNRTVRQAIEDIDSPLSHGYILAMMLVYGEDMDPNLLP